MTFGCDHPDRLAARIFRAVNWLTARIFRVVVIECSCCAFYRGAVIGTLFGAAATALVFLQK